MIKPTAEYSKGFTHTLDELPKEQYASIQKSLKG
jgi:hypothetical protein